ncbi:MAG TPA: hemolysin family protein [Anaerolineae bacterium]|nr:hemolysin family protein [Anaerolineae bacterium]
MLETFLIEIVVILVLILANGFFAASEIAVVSSRKGRLEQQAQEGHRGASAALELAENPNRFLSTVQVGITLISTFAAAFGGASLAEVLETVLMDIPALAPYAGTIALGIVVLAITYLSLIVGELVPKRLALQNAEGIASFIAPPMRLLARLAAPVVTFLTLSTELVLRLLGRHNVPESPITEDDIIALVREGTEMGTVESTEEDFITSVFTFSDQTVRSLMTPKPQIVALDINTPWAKVLATVIEAGYSRLPVYKGSLDDILGVLHVKDLLRVWGQAEGIDLGSLLRPPLYVIESQRAVVAFQQLERSSTALALVLDEYGQVAGLITLEDILEELVGDIGGEAGESEAIKRRKDGSYLVDGILPCWELEEYLNIPEIADFARRYGFETVAGLLLALLGRIPKIGDTASWRSYTFEVVDMDGQRVDKILIVPPRPPINKQNEGVLASGAVLPPPETDTENPG